MRIFLSLLLSFSISSANAADWVALFGGPGSRAALYGMPSSIKSTARGVTIWSLSDFNATEMFENSGVMHRSYMQLSEFDCANRRTRVLSIKVYSGNMGEGKLVLQDEGMGDWANISPSSVMNSLGRMACKTW